MSIFDGLEIGLTEEDIHVVRLLAGDQRQDHKRSRSAASKSLIHHAHTQVPHQIEARRAEAFNPRAGEDSANIAQICASIALLLGE